MKNENNKDFISWHGFSMPIMPEWRPLRIEGGFQKGSMSIGDISSPLFEIRWMRPGAADFDGRSWINGNIKNSELKSASSPPHPNGFSSVGWIRGFEEKDSGKKTVWWGYSVDGQLLLEIIISEIMDNSSYRWIISEALPSLKVFRPGEEWIWRIFSSQFKVPAGFILERHRLNNGDMSLCFMRGKRERLVMRQVYPADLALSRRPLEKWFDAPPFKEKRKFKLESDADGSLEKNRFTVNGWKLIPFPLGFIMPRKCRRIAVVDDATDRIFLVEYEYSEDASGESADNAVKAMSGGAIQ